MDSFELTAILIAAAVIALAVLVALRAGRTRRCTRGHDGAAMTTGTISLAAGGDGGSCDASGGGCD